MTEADVLWLLKYGVGGASVLLYLLFKTHKKPLQRKIGAWAKSRGFDFHPVSTVATNRKMGLPGIFSYENVVITDLPGNSVGCIYRELEKGSPKVRLHEENQEFKDGDLCARIILLKGPTARAVFVPRGESLPPVLDRLAPTVRTPVTSVTPCKRYDMYSDGRFMPQDLPEEFYKALDEYPSLVRVPTLLLDEFGVWLDDPVQRGYDERGYENVMAFCQRLASAIGRWQFPYRAVY